jgi:DNA-binding CsgD family transcriptional regulator
MVEQVMLDRTVSSLYETVLDPARWPEAIANVAGLFSASTAAMFKYDFEFGVPSDFRSFGHDAQVEGLYMSYYHQLDPGRPAGMHAAVGEWVADEQMLDVNAPQQQEYVQDFALRSGIGRAAGFKVAGDSKQCVFLGMQRRPGSDRFGDEGLRAFRAIAPHLRRVTQMQTRIDALAAGMALARACLDRLRAGVVVVDKSRRVILANTCGSQLLGLGNTLRISNQRLVCDQPSIDETLGHAISGACGQHARAGALRIPRRESSAGFLLSVLPVPHAHDLATVSTEPLALVVIGDPGATHLPAGVYQDLFSLTHAEAALLAALVSGLSAGEWAKRRGISIATVRTQLASLFEKTGVDSQARLVGLAKSLPPIS